MSLNYIFSRSTMNLKFSTHFQGQLWSRNSLYTFKVNCDPEILYIFSRSTVIPKFFIYFQGQLWSRKFLIYFQGQLWSWNWNSLYVFEVNCDLKSTIYVFSKSTLRLSICLQGQLWSWNSLYVFKVNCDPEILNILSRLTVTLEFPYVFKVHHNPELLYVSKVNQLWSWNWNSLYVFEVNCDSKTTIYLQGQ